MSGPEFFETPMGQKFYASDVPKIAKALERIAAALERIAAAQPGSRVATEREGDQTDG
jgi:hypothetical protein